jgi:3-phosphoglycerate kinase
MSRTKIVRQQHKYHCTNPTADGLSRWLSRIVECLPDQVRDDAKVSIDSMSPYIVIEVTYTRTETQEEKEQREYDEAIANDIERIRQEAELYGFKLEPLMV